MEYTECVFCDEQQHSSTNILENELLFARWDKYPATPGHAEVMPKRHAQYVKDLTSDELAALMPFAKRVQEIIETTDFTALYEDMLAHATDESRPFVERALSQARSHDTPPDAFNFGINDGPEAGQSVHHLHLHLMPRWKGDVAVPRGGVRQIFAHDEYREIE